MKIIEDNSTPIKVKCTTCNSLLEVCIGEIKKRYINLPSGVIEIKYINSCPCCKTDNADIKYEK